MQVSLGNRAPRSRSPRAAPAPALRGENPNKPRTKPEPNPPRNPLPSLCAPSEPSRSGVTYLAINYNGLKSLVTK